MTKRVTVAEIEADVADYLRAAEEGDTVLVTRDGHAVVALIPAPEPGKAAAGKGLAGLAGGWEGSDELAERIAEIRRTAPRATAGFD